jgi:hypothetical protein
MAKVKQVGQLDPLQRLHTSPGMSQVRLRNSHHSFRNLSRADLSFKSNLQDGRKKFRYSTSIN